MQGDSNDFGREYAVDLAKLIDFIKDTQPEALCVPKFRSLGTRLGQVGVLE